MKAAVRVSCPAKTIRETADLMTKLNAGALPVVVDNKLVGMLTDRDIAVRAVALGEGPDMPVSAVMSGQVKLC